MNTYAEDYTGVYDKDFTITTCFNNVTKGKTLTIKNNATIYLETDLIIRGNMVVEKGSAFKAPEDGGGYVEVHTGAVVTGVDFYYTLILPDGTTGTRKIPLSFDKIWKGKSQKAKDYILNTKFAWSDKYNGWVQTNPARNSINPFDEYELEHWNQVWTRSEQINNTAGRYESITIKNKARINLTTECQHHTYVDGFISVEKGSSFTSDSTLLALKPGCKITGLTLYVYSNDQDLYQIKNLDTLWEINFLPTNDYVYIQYDKTLKAWCFSDKIYLNNIENENKKLFEKSIKKIK